MNKEQAAHVRSAMGSYLAAFGKRRGMTESDKAKQAEVREAYNALDALLKQHGV